MFRKVFVLLAIIGAEIGVGTAYWHLLKAVYPLLEAKPIMITSPFGWLEYIIITSPFGWLEYAALRTLWKVPGLMLSAFVAEH
jgi:hypothetical protein